MCAESASDRTTHDDIVFHRDSLWFLWVLFFFIFNLGLIITPLDSFTAPQYAILFLFIMVNVCIIVMITSTIGQIRITDRYVELPTKSGFINKKIEYGEIDGISILKYSISTEKSRKEHAQLFGEPDSDGMFIKNIHIQTKDFGSYLFHGRGKQSLRREVIKSLELRIGPRWEDIIEIELLDRY